jgi:hypothetical protein
LDKGARLGRNFEAFTKRWFYPKRGAPGQRTFGVEPKDHAQAEIHELLRDVCLTLDPKDYFDLEDPIVNEVWVDLPAKARKLYQDMERKMFLEFEGGDTVEAFGAAAKTQKLLQMASGAVYLDPNVENDRDPRAKKFKVVHEAKMEALESIIDEHDGSPMLVVYSFRSDLARLKKFLGHKAAELANDRELVAFKRGEVDYGLCHPQSLGHGVDGLHHVCWTITHFSHDWPLDTYLQINERIGPMRQLQGGYTDRRVRHNFIFARDTVDEDVKERHLTRGEVQTILWNAMKRRNKR